MPIPSDLRPGDLVHDKLLNRQYLACGKNFEGRWNMHYMSRAYPLYGKAEGFVDNFTPEETNRCHRIRRNVATVFDLGQRIDDSWHHYAILIPTCNTPIIVAGCRTFIPAGARLHWLNRARFNGRVGKASPVNQWSLDAVARAENWARNLK